MSKHKRTRPKFENDHDALVFLMENYQFEGGWIGAGGMGPEGDTEIAESAPPWAKNMAMSFVYDLHCRDLPGFEMAMENVDCQISREDSRLILSRYWSMPLVSEGPSVLQPRVLQEAIISILAIKSPYLGDDVDPCELVWTEESDTGRFSCDTSSFVLYDSEFKDLACDDDQALKILEVLRRPGMTEDKSWSFFAQTHAIHLKFWSLDGDYKYSITGTTKPEDITESCLKSREHCTP